MTDCINIVKRVISFQILRSRNNSVPVRDLSFNCVKNFQFHLDSQTSHLSFSFLAEKETCFFL